MSETNFNNTEIAFRHLSDKDLDFSIAMFKMMNNPALVNVGTHLANFALKIHFPIGGIFKATIFRQFCGGTSLEGCNPKIVELGKANIGAILDYAQEGASKEEEFETTAKELIAIIHKAANTPNIPVSCMKVTGIARFELLEKVSAEQELNHQEKIEYARVIERLDKICHTAYENNVPIYIDAEESWIQIAIDRLTETMMRKYNKKSAIVYTTLQMYRHDKLAHLHKLSREARHEGFIFGVKFVRGAYIEKENQRAEEKGYATPIQPNKEATDKDFDAALKYAVENIDHIAICAGTHNEKSSALLVDLMTEYKIEKTHPNVFFAQLNGMSDHISYNLANWGYNVTKYLPYGPVKSTIPYLIRRAEENSGISGQMSQELTLLIQEKKRRKQ